jgi:hypothetical protein
VVQQKHADHDHCRDGCLIPAAVCFQNWWVRRSLKPMM